MNILKKTTTVFLLLIMVLTLSSCNSENDNSIEINSHELFSEENKVAKIHIDEKLSEFINIDYKGLNKYNISYHVWNDGEIIEKNDKIIALVLSEYSGVSFEIIEKDDKIEIVTGVYSETGEVKYTFPIEIIEDYNLEQIIESTSVDRIYADIESEIMLWGVHEISKETDTANLNSKGFTVTSDSVWSIVIVLSPVE